MIQKKFLDAQRVAVEWLRAKIIQLQNLRATPDSVLTEGRRVSYPLRGRMYFYGYDAKTKSKLPYWDAFPLVVPIENYGSSKILGINFHYLPYNLRNRLLNRVTETINEEQDGFTLRYRDIKSSLRFNYAIPCIHRYDLNNVRSNIIEVEPQERLTAINLPVERFKKQSRAAVWRDSRARI